MAGLTAARVRNLRNPGRYGDSDGLYLNVAPTGTRSWVQRIQVDGKRRDIGLGGFPTISLAKAREWASDNRRRVAEGTEPLSSKARRVVSLKTATSKPTFRNEALAFHAENAGARWTHKKNIKAWLQRAEKYLFPVLGDKPIDEIDGADVLNILVPLQQAKPETSTRLRVILRQTFARSMSRGVITSNPAGEAISGGLPPRRSTATHMRALHYSKVAGALQTVRDSAAWLGTKLAFEFLVLTASRSGEVRGATWDEIDLEGSIWTLSASRMKARREHLVPLSGQAIAVLAAAHQLSGDSNLLFQSSRGRAPSDNTISKLLRENGITAVPHGFRSSFRDWAAECSGASWAAVELSLAHRVGNNVEQAYFRSDLLDQRRQLMQAWSDYVMGEEAN